MPATEDYLRPLPLMHKIFCASAAALLAVTFWMMYVDFDDEWRSYQRAAIKAVVERDLQKKQTLEGSAAASLTELTEAVSAAKKAASQSADEIAAAEVAVNNKAEEAARTMRVLRVERARRDVDRANFNLAVRDALPNTDEFKSKFDQSQLVVDEREGEYKVKDFEVAQAKSSLAQLTQVRDQAEKDLKAAKSDIDRIQKSVDKMAPSPFSLQGVKRSLMHLPIIDGFNSPERVIQDWMPALKIDLGGMTKVDRFDRCRTCHYNIDAVDGGTDPAFAKGEYAHPNTSHPRLDLYLTSGSPHPLPKFGCTSCHAGQGSGTTFQNASHSPNHPAEIIEWQKDHGWFDNHFWEHPMHPKRFEESGCIKCHIHVVELGVNSKFGATAPQVYRGYQLVKTYGCFGCHEINGYEGSKQVGVDLRLEPTDPAELAAAASDPQSTVGKMRKVGPSLVHVASKVDRGWLESWTEEPKKFRPSTKMPQFYKQTNQDDHDAARFNPVELAGMAEYLLSHSVDFTLESPASDYVPDAARGKELFGTKGCVACHSHQDVTAPAANFGPELSRMHEKMPSGTNGFYWVYSWIRNPEKYHPRTKMPNLYLDIEVVGGSKVDAAADIAAFLLKAKTPGDYKRQADYVSQSVDVTALDDLVQFFLQKQFKKDLVEQVMAAGDLSVLKSSLKGDDLELLGDGTAPAGDEWRRRKLAYIGRKTISRYGCYGCHNIPGFEEGRPIGVALQDWGRKDRSRLAFEHISEFLHHHGQASLGVSYRSTTRADGGSGGLGVTVTDFDRTLQMDPVAGVRMVDGARGAADQLQVGDLITSYDQQAVATDYQLRGLLNQTSPGSEVVVHVVRDDEAFDLLVKVDGSFAERAHAAVAQANAFTDEKLKSEELRAAYFYESLHHHGRPGFIWQKLRQPRSYDYMMTGTKPYDDRLRMPKFPFSEDDIEAVATFVLGLVNDPPVSDYLFNPAGPKGAVVRGEQLIEQFNCSSCHVLELPKIEFAMDPEEVVASDGGAEFPEAVRLLTKLKPPHDAQVGRTKRVKLGNERTVLPLLQMHGMVTQGPSMDDAPEDREWIFESWETLSIAGKILFPTSKFIFNDAQFSSLTPAKGGDYAEWLVSRLVDTKVAKEKSRAWQMSPPPLYKEGIKVQTSWLYNFLLNPGKLRPMAVLRMPRFNLNPTEAQSLANYFAAVDEAPFPYQPVPQREVAYLATKDDEFKQKWPTKPHDYLHESWQMLNSPLCVKCHAVGGRQPAPAADPNEDIKGPNLQMAGDRLQPDWLQLWLYQPKWVTPYTSMPQNLPPGKKLYDELFEGDPDRQTKGLRDALLNYHRLMEQNGKTVYEPPQAQAAVERGGN